MKAKKTTLKRATWVDADQFKPIKLTSSTVKGRKIDELVRKEREQHSYLTRSLVK
jgi:hypothetical protein